MNIRAGYRISFNCLNSTPINLMLSVHPDRRGDLITPDSVRTSVACPLAQVTDSFGNLITRVKAPAGPITFTSNFLIHDSGRPDAQNWAARQIAVEALPAEALPFLLGSRYCETDRLGDLAWSMFGHATTGWGRVQAIVDYVHRRLRFSYPHACPTRTAQQGHEEQVGVCRDFAHLAVTLCRAMNIPARYCTGYLGDIGIAPVGYPMDFSAWFEAYLEGGWYAFDARHNVPRIGRIVIARGRDAADVALTHTFGTARLTDFKVITDEVDPAISDARSSPRMMAAE